METVRKQLTEDSAFDLGANLYPTWAHVKSTKRGRNNTQTTQEEERNKCNNRVIPYVVGMPEEKQKNLQHSETETGSPQGQNSQIQT